MENNRHITIDGLKASWIWADGDSSEVNTYVQFRHEFFLDEPVDKNAKMRISTDTDYALWVNGEFVNCGQYDDFPENKAFDELPAGEYFKQGKNSLCILAWHQGENSFQYIKGEPALVYFIEGDSIYVSSGENTRCRRCEAYKSGPVPKISRQLGFTFEFDSNREDSWTDESYVMGDDWRCPVSSAWSNQKRKSLYKRPVKKLVIKGKADVRILSQGIFRRVPDSSKTVAQMMQADFLSNRMPEDILGVSGIASLPSEDGIFLNNECFQENQGIYLLLDLGREEAGLFHIDLDTDSGTIIDIAYGEHLYDLRVTARAGDRNFAHRYICKEGRQNFTHYFTRLGCRYIQLHISKVKNKCRLYYAGLLPVEYPVEFKGEFYCSDLLHQKICSVAVRTLHLCMHEHYEDTPMREQALYSMDSRNQALCGYYCFGEYDYPKAAIALLAESLRSDGYLEMCSPARPRKTIPSFSMIWFQELYEFYMYSGCIDFVKKMIPTMKTMLSKYTDSLVEFLLPSPKGYWNFYEWADGLDGGGPDAYTEELIFDAPLSLFFVMALNASEKLFRACGEIADAENCASLKETVGKAVHDAFWDEKEKAYATSICEGVRKRHYAELTQSLALYAKVCPESSERDLRSRLASRENGFVPITLSYSIFKFEALLQDEGKYGKEVFSQVADIWSHMLYNNATSFWETIDVTENFRDSWSFCHGWSAIPVYLYYAYVLGVKPIEPGFRRYTKKPVSSDIDRAWGVVPIPGGKLSIE